MPNGIPEPSACSICDVARRGHFQRWTVEIGWHQYAEPSQGLIKHRMRQRRLARQIAKTPKPVPPECHITLTVEDKVTPAVKGAIEAIDLYLWTNEMRGEDA